jgi:hypothetical protein
MIDLIHLERLRQRRRRYEAAQREMTQAAVPAGAAARPRPNDRRAFLRVVSAVVVGWAVDGTATRSHPPRARR